MHSIFSNWSFSRKMPVTFTKLFSTNGAYFIVLTIAGKLWGFPFDSPIWIQSRPTRKPFLAAQVKYCCMSLLTSKSYRGPGQQSSAQPLAWFLSRESKGVIESEWLFRSRASPSRLSPEHIDRKFPTVVTNVPFLHLRHSRMLFGSSLMMPKSASKNWCFWKLFSCVARRKFEIFKCLMSKSVFSEKDLPVLLTKSTAA